MLFRQLLQHILRRGNGLALAPAGRRGQAEMHKKHFSKLLGRVDVESPSGQLKDPLSHPLQFHGKSF